MINDIQDTSVDLLKDLKMNGEYTFPALDTLVDAGNKFVKDIRINLRNALNSNNLDPKEAALIAIAVAVNERSNRLAESFKEIALEAGATDAEIAEAYACASLLATNNVFYRFRHFAEKESYHRMPARIKMSIMIKPVTGKAFFELMSLAVSAVNGCEACVRSHEHSVVELGISEEKVFDAVRLSAIIVGLSKVVD